MRGRALQKKVEKNDKINDEKNISYRNTVRMLGTILYLFCVLNAAGISVNPDAARERTAEVSMNPDAAREGTAEVSVNPDAVREIAKETMGDAQNGDTVSETPFEKKKIALTFDDGPSSTCTKRLLEGLKKRNVKATFFVLGEKVEENPELVREIVGDGHLIGNHTYSHTELNKLSEKKAKEELTRASNAIFKETGRYPEYMRPPYGECTKKLEDSVDMILVRWSIDPRDWEIQNTDKIVRKVVTQAGENDIILLHDCYDTSVDAALEIVDILKDEGFEFVTVDELYLN